MSEQAYSGPEGALVIYAYQTLAALFANTVADLSYRSGIGVDYAALRASAERHVKSATSTGLSYEQENAAINAGLAVIDDFFSRLGKPGG